MNEVCMEKQIYEDILNGLRKKEWSRKSLLDVRRESPKDKKMAVSEVIKIGVRLVLQCHNHHLVNFDCQWVDKNGRKKSIFCKNRKVINMVGVN